MNESTSDMEESIRHASRLICDSKYLVALVGAGMSVESGIPPFRGPGGLWTRYGEPRSLSYQGYIQDPAGWWRDRLRDEKEPGNPTQELRIAADNARPNPGHYALTNLERMGILKYTITQNVDDLHSQSGSINVAEIHGNRTKFRCLSCGARLPRDGFPMVVIPPRCPYCDGLIKIDSVMFGEPIPADVMATCLEQVEKSDCLLMIGTSGTVRPASDLPRIAKDGGATLMEINPHKTSLTPSADLVLRGSSGEILPQLVRAVKESLEN